MRLFRRDEQHTDAAAEKPDVERAVQEARDALQEAGAALGEHDAAHARLLRELEASTAALDSATLAGEEREIDTLIRQRFDLNERIASLDRVRGHRANQVERARQHLYQVERAAAHDQQRGLIDLKIQLNQQIVKAVEGLGGLIEQAEDAQRDISQLADTWQLDRPAVRWSLSPGFIRSTPAELLRNALDLHHVFGLDSNASRIMLDNYGNATLSDEELELLAEHVALTEEVAHA